MPKTAGVDTKALEKLGLQRLIELIAEESEANPKFRKRVKAALTVLKGPAALAREVEKQLSAIERAKSAVTYEREAALAADLRVTVRTIATDLAAHDTGAAAENLLRFIATSEHVLQRVFNGRLVNPVYDDALETLVELLPGLPEKSAALLPPLATKLLLDDHDGLGLTTALALAGRLPASVRNAWDEALAKLPRAKAPQKNPFWIDRSGDAAIAVRMALADVDGNLDRWVTLAASLSPNARSPLAIARRLHEAGRHAEALKWVREKSPRSLVRHLRRTDFGFVVVGDEMHEDRIMLEADILWAIGEREAAQQTRWDWFEKSLQVEPLRAYIAALDDFAEFEETDRAFAVVDTSKDIFSALSFYLLWPRNDRAAALVLRNRAAWSGQHYDLLSAAADILEEAHAAAAVVLYRALLNDILNNGKSQAYGHAARYWLRLVDLSAAADPALGIDNHAAYGAELRKKHGRKHGFVYAVKQQGGSF